MDWLGTSALSRRRSRKVILTQVFVSVRWRTSAPPLRRIHRRTEIGRLSEIGGSWSGATVDGLTAFGGHWQHLRSAACVAYRSSNIASKNLMRRRRPVGTRYFFVPDMPVTTFVRFSFVAWVLAGGWYRKIVRWLIWITAWDGWLISAVLRLRSHHFSLRIVSWLPRDKYASPTEPRRLPGSGANEVKRCPTVQSRRSAVTGTEMRIFLRHIKQLAGGALRNGRPSWRPVATLEAGDSNEAPDNLFRIDAPLHRPWRG